MLSLTILFTEAEVQKLGPQSRLLSRRFAWAKRIRRPCAAANFFTTSAIAAASSREATDPAANLPRRNPAIARPGWMKMSTGTSRRAENPPRLRQRRLAGQKRGRHPLWRQGNQSETPLRSVQKSYTGGRRLSDQPAENVGSVGSKPKPGRCHRHLQCLKR